MSCYHLAKTIQNQCHRNGIIPFKRFYSASGVVSSNYAAYKAHHRQRLLDLKIQKIPGKTLSQKLSTSEAAAAATTVSTAGENAIQIIPWYASFWQTVSESKPVACMQNALIEIHDFTGLPWWATIVLSTILFRTLITLPLTVYQHKITARIENLALEMPAIVEELKREAAIAKKQFGWSEEKTRAVYRLSLKKQWNNLIVRDNCHPAKTLIVLWGQIPLWICQSVALRNLVQMLPDPSALEAKIIFTELTIGGFGWIPNLTEVDSSYILPVTLGLLNLGIIEIQSVLRKRQPTRLQVLATNAFRGLSILMVPVACSVPSALCVYWVTSSAHGLAQNLLMVSPTVRRAVGIPQTKSEILEPYERLWNHAKIRTGLMQAPLPTEEKTTTTTTTTTTATKEDSMNIKQKSTNNSLTKKN